MLRLILIIGMSSPCWSAGVQCNEDSHCAEGYYCELDYSCRKCLRCVEDFQRAPPPVPISCIKSTTECGACIEGKSHSSNNECGGANVNPNEVPYHTSGSSESKEIRLPVYAWVLLVLIVAVVIGGVTLIPWINRATYATVPRSESQIPPGTSVHSENAWSSPPAYNTVVDIPRPTSEEDTALYVKSETIQPLDNSRESADRQATRPYSPPNYVRHPHPSPTIFHEPAAISNTEDQSSVDGVIAVQIQPMSTVDDALPIETTHTMDLEGCPNIASSGHNQFNEPSLPNVSRESIRGPPVVVVNNNVHLQSVSLSGTIF